MKCPKCGVSLRPSYKLGNITSYILYKPEIETGDICYNAKTKLCFKCEEPECNLQGIKFTIGESK